MEAEARQTSQELKNSGEAINKIVTGLMSSARGGHLAIGGMDETKFITKALGIHAIADETKAISNAPGIHAIADAPNNGQCSKGNTALAISESSGSAGALAIPDATASLMAASTCSFVDAALALK